MLSSIQFQRATVVCSEKCFLRLRLGCIFRFYLIWKFLIHYIKWKGLVLCSKGCNSPDLLSYTWRDASQLEKFNKNYKFAKPCVPNWVVKNFLNRDCLIKVHLCIQCRRKWISAVKLSSGFGTVLAEIKICCPYYPMVQTYPSSLSKGLIIRNQYLPIASHIYPVIPEGGILKIWDYHHLIFRPIFMIIHLSDRGLHFHCVNNGLEPQQKLVSNSLINTVFSVFRG